MGEKKVTKMELKVDLQCSKCYKKVKKVLGKFPEIQEQIFDEKQNKVTIKVVCCNPEKIRDKIRCKGGCSIKCIKILQPPPPRQPSPPPPPPPLPPPPPPPPPPCCKKCCGVHGGGPCYQPCCKQGRYCVGCYRRPVCDSWSCSCKQGRYCDGCYRRPVCNSWGSSSGCHRDYCRSRCTDYICEENPTACTIM